MSRRKCGPCPCGAYSDYCVMYVLATEEAANDLCQKLNGPRDADESIYQREGAYFVEDFDFFPETPPTYTTYHAYENLNGGEMWVREEIAIEEPPQRPKVRVSPTRSGVPMQVMASCGDRGAAIKSVKDRVAAIKANAHLQENA